MNQPPTNNELAKMIKDLIDIATKLEERLRIVELHTSVLIEERKKQKEGKK